MATDLDQFVESKRQEIAQFAESEPLIALQERAQCTQNPRDLLALLQNYQGQLLLADCSKDSDPIGLAKLFENVGTIGLIVTMEHGAQDDRFEAWQKLHNAVSQPLINNELIVEEYQIYQSRLFGADGYFLDARLHDLAALQYLVEVGRDLNMTALIRVYDQTQLATAMRTDAEILSLVVNNQTDPCWWASKEYDFALQKRIVFLDVGGFSTIDFVTPVLLPEQGLIIGPTLTTNSGDDNDDAIYEMGD